MLLKTLLLVLATLLRTEKADSQNGKFYEHPGVSSAEILKALNYQVEEVYLITPDGYKLNLVHATNPLIKNSNKVPILFVHGILTDSNVFVINSFDVEPKDFSHLNLANESEYELILLDSSSKSLPLLALNCGHEVWLLNRRGAPGSQKRVATHSYHYWDNIARQASDRFPSLSPIASGPLALVANGQLFQLLSLTFDSRFWNYSLDEQVEYDFPLCVNYISNQNKGSKVAVVGHSAGGTITLLSLSEQPELAEKISSAILWSEGASLGFNDLFRILAPLRPVLESYSSSFPPAFSTTQIQAFLNLFCLTGVTQRGLCESFADLILGQSGGKEPITPEFISSLLYPTSTHELAQLLQNVDDNGEPHKYDYGSSEANQAKYNQLKPPPYNLSRVTLDRISFYAGRTDFLVSEEDIRYSSKKLRVSYLFNLIDGTFNHQGYFYHDENEKLAIGPSLRDIHRFSAST